MTIKVRQINFTRVLRMLVRQPPLVQDHQLD